ncbi:hypothetical protein EDB84DRAFT_1568078 [Lactarius hengduanensis]|nr:hypothetical protein EDB84DRAFT_1568078 [Lactarius hengduanensis]
MFPIPIPPTPTPTPMFPILILIPPTPTPMFPIPIPPTPTPMFPIPIPPTPTPMLPIPIPPTPTPMLPIPIPPTPTPMFPISIPPTPTPMFPILIPPTPTPMFPISIPPTPTPMFPIPIPPTPTPMLPIPIPPTPTLVTVQVAHYVSTNITPPTKPSVAVPKAAGNLKCQTTRRPAANAQLDLITSGNEFSLQDVQDVEDEDDICDSDLPAGDPSDRSPVLAPHKPPVTTTKTAVDLIYFFTEIDFPNATKDNEKTQKVCKLCIKIYGTNKSKVPRSVANYFYLKNTGNSNLRRHLSKQHTKVYDNAISKKKVQLELQAIDPIGGPVQTPEQL